MKVAVIQGGPSAEAEVSRASGAAVARALEEAGHAAAVVELNPRLAGELLALSPDVVFPVAHGSQGEDGCLQGMLEILGLPYVGSGVRASALAADKVSAKTVYSAAGLPVAGQRVVRPSDRVRLAELRDELGHQLIVKPAEGGSTLGMSRLLKSASEEDWQAALQLARSHASRVLVEELVVGTELTCGVLEVDGEPRALPPTQVSAIATEWYDFESKYAPGGSRHQCPAPISEELTRRVQEAAVLAHDALGARHLSRTDVICRTHGGFVLLETNTLPGMTDVSLFPEAAEVAGWTFPQLIHGLVQSALDGRRAAPPASPKLPGR